MTPSRTGASRADGLSSGRTKGVKSFFATPESGVAKKDLSPLAVQAGKRPLAVLARLAADLADVGDALEPRDLALAFEPGGMVGLEAADEGGDAVAELQREVRRRGAHELAHVLDRDLVVGGAAARVLGFAHFVVFVLACFDLAGADCSLAERSTGTIWRRASIRACTAVEMAASSPISQP